MLLIRVFSALSILAVINASRSQQVGPSRVITDTFGSIRERHRTENNRKAFFMLNEVTLTPLYVGLKVLFNTDNHI